MTDPDLTVLFLISYSVDEGIIRIFNGPWNARLYHDRKVKMQLCKHLFEHS